MTLTLLDRDISGVGGGHEGGLRQGVLQREEFILGHRLWAGLEDSPGPDGGKVEALRVAQSDETAVVLASEVAVLELIVLPRLALSQSSLKNHHTQKAAPAKLFKVGLQQKWTFDDFRKRAKPTNWVFQTKN